MEIGNSFIYEALITYGFAATPKKKMYVEYEEMDGSFQSDIWTVRCLMHELELSEVRVLYTCAHENFD